MKVISFSAFLLSATMISNASSVESSSALSLLSTSSSSSSLQQEPPPKHNSNNNNNLRGSSSRGLSELPDDEYCFREVQSHTLDDYDYYFFDAISSGSVFLRNAASNNYIGASGNVGRTPFNADHIVAVPLELEQKRDPFASSHFRWSLTQTFCPSNAICPNLGCFLIETTHFNGDI